MDVRWLSSKGGQNDEKDIYEPTPKSVCIKNAFHFVTNRGADVANMAIGNDVLLDMVSYSDKVKAP